MSKEPQVRRNLQATADLLDALQENPTLLNDEEFMRRLSILREKHEETTNFLAKKVGAPPLPTVITSSKTTESKTTQSSSKIEMMTSCHQRFIDPATLPCHLNLNPNVKSSRTEEFREKEFEYHLVNHEDFHSPGNTDEPIYMIPRQFAPEPPRVHTSPPKPRVPVRVAPPLPTASRQHEPPPPSPKKQRHQIHVALTTGIPRQKSQQNLRSASLHRNHHVSRKPADSETVRQVLATASAKYKLPTASVAMPSGLLLTSTNTKHMPRHEPQFATTSDVVEESFLEDGLSTTREVSTIVDDMVADPHRTVKRQLENGILKNRSKSLHNMAEAQVTIPRPFQLSLRKSIGNTYAKKFVSDMMSEKQRRDDELKKSLANTKFKAKPVPKSTYMPTNTFATEQKYVEAMRKKVAAVARRKFEAQNEMVRSKSEGNLSSIKPLGYVPPTTYVSPIPVKGNARGRSAATRTAIMIQEATTPKGIKSHRAQSNLTHHLRHGKCKLDTTAVVQHRRTSPPDFNKIHAKINEEYRRLNSKPSTVPMPFKFAHRSQSATSRHTNCKEKEPEQFKPSSANFSKPTPNRVPSTHSAQLREELTRARIQKEKEEEAEKNSFWAEDNKRRIASFLGTRSKTDEDIAMRTRLKLHQQQETTQEYMRQLTEMKQRVLNGPLIMEKQSALAQEHRLKRKFEERMKSAKGRSQAKLESRRGSETSAAGTFVVEKEDDYREEKFESKTSSGKGSGSGSKSGSGSSKSEASSSETEESSQSEASSTRSSQKSSSQSSESKSSEDDDDSAR